MRGRRYALFAVCSFCALSGAFLGGAGGMGTGGVLALALALAAAALSMGAITGGVQAPSKAPELKRDKALQGAPALAEPRAARDTRETALEAARESRSAEILSGDAVSELASLRGRLAEDLERMRSLQALSQNLRVDLVELAGRVATAARQNQDLLEGAERDGEKVGQEIQALVGVKEALHQGTAVIDDLSKRSREVGPVIESIFVVARKTNMLALNAAIEAARAGEQGKGFAVVAEEVRRLAEAATASTQKVENFVEGLRVSTASAIEVLKGASRVEETIPVVYRISDAFVTLVPAVEAANKSLGELSELVSRNVGQVTHVHEAAETGINATNLNLARLDGILTSLGQRGK